MDDYTLKVIDPYYHPPTPDPAQSQQTYGNNGVMSNINTLNVGMGANGMYVDKEGLRLGDPSMSKAPFSVDMLGQLVASKATFKNQSGAVIIDPIGIVSTSNFTSTSGGSALSLNQPFANNIVTDITGATFSFNIPRITNILILASIISFFTHSDSNNYRGNGVVILSVNGSEYTRTVQTGGVWDTNTIGSGDIVMATSELHYLSSFSPGATEIKLRAWMDTVYGNPVFTIYLYRFSYIFLGS